MAAIAAGATACASLDALSGGQDAPDAATDVTADAAADAIHATDAPHLTDATPATDAAADARAPDASTYDAAPADTGFCASLDAGDADFYRCFDYDTSSTGPVDPGGYGGGAVTVSLDDGPSQPNALVARTPALDAGEIAGGSDSVDVLPVGAAVRAFTLAFDARAEAFQDMHAIFAARNAAGWGFFIQCSSSSCAVLEQTNTNGYHASVPISGAGWHHFEAQVSLELSVFSLTIDRQLVYQNEALALPPGPGPLTFQPGIVYVGGPYGPVVVHYDNVVLHATL